MTAQRPPIRLRDHRPQDDDGCLGVTRAAFWDVYRPGCHEHLLWHRLVDGHPDLLPWSAVVAEARGQVVGCIAATRAWVVGDGRTPVAALGPLAVLPDWQGQGIGGRLLTEVLRRAEAAREGGAFLYGDPRYYQRFGFGPASALGVRTADGSDVPALMGLELAKGALDGVRGRLIESGVFEVDEREVTEFDARFPVRVPRG